MAARSIVTSHPDVQCSFCGRRLLRGEHPEVFFIAGQRRLVCELCGPRAAHEGWLRESQANSRQEQESSRPARRGRRLLERLSARRQGSGAPAQAGAGADSPGPSIAPGPPIAEQPRAPRGFPYEASAPPGEESFDFIAPAPEDTGPLLEDSTPHPNGFAPPAGERLTPAPLPASRAPDAGAWDLLDRRTPLAAGFDVVEAPPANGVPGDLLEPSLSSFNASEHVERIASIARLLGPPCVSLRTAPGQDQSLWITVAWDICWHRYEVTPHDPHGPRRVAEGMELDELAPEDRTANALADEHGRLRPASV